MSLALATLVTAVLFLATGGLLLWNGPAVGATARAFPRSRRAAYVLFGVGAAWFLWRVWHLSEADFGDYRLPLVAVFGTVAVLSFRLVPDFLAVRGLAIVVLLGARDLLAAAFMRWEHPQRLLLVAAVYGAIAAALFLAAYPYRLRDFLGWLFARPGRPRAIGTATTAYGVALLAVAFTY
jgi:hypothetical protein